MDPFRVRIPLKICPFEWGEGRVHSLNHQVYKHPFKVTTPHYKHLLSRQEAMKAGGPDGAAHRKRVEAPWAAHRAESGKATRALSSPALLGTNKQL